MASLGHNELNNPRLLRDMTTTNGAVFDITQILAYLVHNMINYTWDLAILAD